MWIGALTTHDVSARSPGLDRRVKGQHGDDILGLLQKTH